MLAIYWEKNRTPLESEKSVLFSFLFARPLYPGIGFLIVHVDTEMEYVKWHLFAKRIAPAASIHQIEKMSEKFSKRYQFVANVIKCETLVEYSLYGSTRKKQIAFFFFKRNLQLNEGHQYRQNEALAKQ